MSKVFFNIAYTSKSPPSKLKGKARAEYIARRAFHDMTAEYNWFTYSLNERKVEKNKDSLDYYTRSGKNTGLFDLNGGLDNNQIEELKTKLSKSDSIIWHGFVSFDAETSKNFDTQEKAQRFMRQTFGEFLKNSHLDKKNIDFFAALHTDAEHHHHIHFSFFERQPKHRNKKGELGYTKIGSFNPEIIDNYLVSANMHVSESSYTYYTARDRAMAKLRTIKARAILDFGEKEIKTRLTSLVSHLPQTGRLQYNSANMQDFRKEIDAIANILIRSNPEALKAHNEMQHQLAIKERETIQLAKENKLAYVDGRRLSKNEIEELTNGGKVPLDSKYLDPSKIKYMDNLRSEYQSRLGNYVLSLCKELKRDYRQQRRDEVNNKHLKIQARINRLRRNHLISQAMQAIGEYQKGIKVNFMKNFKEIEYEIQQTAGI